MDWIHRAQHTQTHEAFEQRTLSYLHLWRCAKEFVFWLIGSSDLILTINPFISIILQVNQLHRHKTFMSLIYFSRFYFDQLLLFCFYYYRPCRRYVQHKSAKRFMESSLHSANKSVVLTANNFVVRSKMHSTDKIHHERTSQLKCDIHSSLPVKCICSPASFRRN